MDILRQIFTTKGGALTTALFGGCALFVAVAAISLSGKEEAQAASLTHSMLAGFDAGGTDNVALSPASAVIALGLTAEGAPDDVREGLPAELSADAWTFPIPNAQAANAVWVNKGTDLKDAFAKAAADNWQADAQAVDFAKDALGIVNAWAKEKTEGMIDPLMSEIPEDLAVVLTNAVYFKAPWTRPFDPAETEAAAFTKADGSEVSAPFMTSPGAVKSGTFNAMQVVELTFGEDGAADGTAMYILLPNSGADVSAQDPFADMAAMKAALTEDVKVKLPRFKVSGGGDMTEMLSTAGYGTLMGASLTEMSPDAPQISMVVQKCVVAIDEAGAEAAAATAVVTTRSVLQPEYPVITIDRPFYFVITDGTSPVPLFAGYVAEPETAG